MGRPAHLDLAFAAVKFGLVSAVLLCSDTMQAEER